MGVIYFQDRLVAEAVKLRLFLESNSNSENKEEAKISSKSNNLAKELGFINSANYIKFDKSGYVTNKYSNHLIRFIKDFSEKFPEVILVSEDVLNMLCKENELIKTLPERYLGEVPEEFMNDMSSYINKIKGFESNRFTYKINNVSCGYYLSNVTLSRLFKPEVKLLEDIMDNLLIKDTHYSSDMSNYLCDRLESEECVIVDKEWIYDRLHIKYLGNTDILICAPKCLCKPSVEINGKKYEELPSEYKLKLIAYIYLQEGLVGIISTHGSYPHSSLLTWRDNWNNDDISI